MIYNAEYDGPCVVLDPSGREIRNCTRVDTDTGFIEFLEVGADGHFLLTSDELAVQRGTMTIPGVMVEKLDDTWTYNERLGQWSKGKHTC